MSWILWIAKNTQPNIRKRASKTGVPQLIVIPYSHYCELAIWSFDLSGKAYETHGYAPCQHILPVLAVRMGGTQKYLSSSSFVQAVTKSDEKGSNDKSRDPRTGIQGQCGMNEKKADNNAQSDAKAERSRATAVPLMAMPDGRILSDSWEIANESGLPKIDEKAMAAYDQEIGPLARQFAYYFLLKPSNRAVWDGLATSGRGWAWRWLWWLGLGTQVTKLMAGIFGVNDAAAFSECRRKLVIAFDALAPRLRASQGRFLAGDALGVADIALAALAAPVVLPPGYCRGAYAQWFGALEERDAELRAELAHWRATAVGAYTLAIYAEHRTPHHKRL